MGFTKIGGKWVSKDGDKAGSSSGIHVKDDEGEPVVVVAGSDGDDRNQVGQDNVGYDDAFGAGASARNMGERITSMSPLRD